MQTKTWKKERKLLGEAYDNVHETTHSIENSIREDEDAEHYKKTGEIKKKEDVKEEGSYGKSRKKKISEEIGDEVTSLPGGDIPEEFAHEPDEVDAEIESLKNLILNPPTEMIERYAKEGQLHVYVDMLKKKLDAAEAVKTAVRGEEG